MFLGCKNRTTVKIHLECQHFSSAVEIDSEKTFNIENSTWESFIKLKYTTMHMFRNVLLT